MTDGLNLVAKDLTTGRIETIELGIGLKTHIILIVIIEARHGIGHLFLILLIPRFLEFLEDGITIEIDRGADCEVIKGREAGRNGNGVRHTVLPVFR